MNNALIVCPTCAMKGDHSVLGAVKPDGSLVIRRWVKNKPNQETTIISSSLTVVCQCGYGTTLSTTITQIHP